MSLVDGVVRAEVVEGGHPTWSLFRNLRFAFESGTPISEDYNWVPLFNTSKGIVNPSLSIAWLYDDIDRAELPGWA